jgi:hypothetical protein
MVRWSLFLVVVILLFCVQAFGQTASASWQYGTSGGTPLDTTCSGPVHIPDGWLIKIFWDSDSSGVDPSDPQPTLCAAPPTCTGGPNQTCNYNRFYFNGTALGTGPGYFGTVTNFRYNSLPPRPMFYLRVYSPADTVHEIWTSTIKRLNTGIQTFSFVRANWTCTPQTPQCTVKNASE